MPPEEVKTIAELHLYKQLFMVASQKKFNVRHPWFYYRKTDVFNNLGTVVNVPEIIFYGRAKEFNVDNLSKRDKFSFVLKRNIGHSSQGVWVFVLDEDSGNYVEILHGRLITIQELLSAMDAEESIVAERCLGCSHEAIPFDFKVLMYDNKPKLVLMVDRNKGKPLITYVSAEDLSIILPEKIYYSFPAARWSVADQISNINLERVSIAIEFSLKVASFLRVSSLFLSIDTYVTHCGHVPSLGEITVKPGGVYSPWVRPDIIRNWFDIEFPNIQETVIH